jgi:hypothetical protein
VKGLTSKKKIKIKITYAVENNSVLKVECHIEQADKAVDKIKLEHKKQLFN